MRKILIIVGLILLVAVIAMGGFIIYQTYFGSRTSSNSNTTQVCNTQEQTCVPVGQVLGSGSLNVKVTGGSKSLSNLEVDLGVKAGAISYFMSRTNTSGVAPFGGIPAGSYVIYFNQNNFPAGFAMPSPRVIQITPGKTQTVEIKL